MNFNFRLILKKTIICLWIIGISLNTTAIGAYHLSRGQERWTEDLNLTSEQIQNLKDLQIRFRQELAQIRKKIIITRMELRTLTPEEFKGDKGEEFRLQIQSLLLQARERSLVYQKEALTVLTPEQRGKLSSGSHLGFHCGRWFRGGGGPGMGSGKGSPVKGPFHEMGPQH